MIRSERGVVTTDFLFAVIVAFGMSALVFSLTFTLSVVEITQYIVYSAARAQAGAHENPDKQATLARNKYDQLKQNPVFSPLYSNGWFEISSKTDLEIAQGKETLNRKSFADDYPARGGTNRESFHGVRTTLTAKMLELTLPLIGKVTPEDDGFKTRIAAILIREPTQQECQDYMRVRREKLWEIDNRRFTALPRAPDIAVPWEDNGC